MDGALAQTNNTSDKLPTQLLKISTTSGSGVLSDNFNGTIRSMCENLSTSQIFIVGDFTGKHIVIRLVSTVLMSCRNGRRCES